MNGAAAVRDAYHADYRRLAAHLPGQELPWLAGLRADALRRFMEAGLPSVREEAWKYTDVRPIAARHFAPADGAPAAIPSLKRFALGEGAAHRLVFLDGRLVAELSVVCALPPGVRIMGLAAALAHEPGALEPHLGRYVSAERDGFAALNTALMADGAYVRLARDALVPEPIHLLFVSSGGADRAAHVRNLIIAEPGSRATVVEHYVALADGCYLTNAVTEIALDDGASLEHYRLDRDGEAAYHVAASHARLKRDARYAAHSIAIGGRLTRNDLDVVLDAPGADCRLNGLYLARGRQHVDNHTRIDHRAPRGTSREWYKGVLDGESRGVFSGRVVVHPGAQQSDAQQTNNNLLLSEGAEADSRPQLEIYADDVKCAHGSTVGQLDAEALFYLRSRALDERLARNLLVYAFAHDVLARMRLAPVRALIEQRLAAPSHTDLPVTARA